MNLPFEDIVAYVAGIFGIIAGIPVVWSVVMWLRQRAQHGRPAPSSSPIALPPSYTTLPSPPAPIVGRGEQLHLLRHRLGIGGRPPEQITAIHGFPGQGKTSLVLALAYDEAVRKAFPGGVLWADLGENPNLDLTVDLARWGDALGEPQVREAPDLREAIRRMGAVLQGRRALLIVDDVWEKDHAAVFLRARGDCPLIVTTRAAEIAEHVAQDSDDRIRLRGLSLEAGMDLMEQLAPDAVHRFEPDVRALVEAVEGLPLALQVAGRVLRIETEADLDDMRVRIRELASGELLDAEVPAQLERETNNRTVAALLRRSIDYLDDETRERFVFLGGFVAKPATFALEDMAAAWLADDPGPTVRRLIERGLLEPATNGRYQMHALLADLAAAMLDELP